VPLVGNSIEGEHEGPLIDPVGRDAGGGSVGTLTDNDGLDEARMDTRIHRHHGRRTHQESGGLQRALFGHQVGQTVGSGPGGTGILIQDAMGRISTVELQGELHLKESR
jgi:hypothetical protein